MKSQPTSPRAFFITSLLLWGAFVFQANAKDDIFGTPDTDGDGDGDPIGNNVGLLVDSNITDGGGNPVYNTLGLVSDGTPTEYWVTSQTGSQHWRDYTAFPDSETQIASRVLETLSPGDTYFYRQSSALGFEEYTMAWRDSNGNLPTGTLMSFGFGFSGEPIDINGGTITGNNMTNLFGSDGPNTGTLIAPTGYDGSLGNYHWFNYSVNNQGRQSVFTIKDPQFNGTPTVVGDIIWFIKFPDTLLAGETMPVYNPWALSGYDRNGNFISVTPGTNYYLSSLGEDDPAGVQNDDPTNDLVFSWTVDNKTTQWGPENTNFITLVPEPGTAFMAALSMLVLVLRRKRH